MTMGVLAVRLGFISIQRILADFIPALPLTEIGITKSGTYSDCCCRTYEAQNRQGVPSRPSFQPRREEILRAARFHSSRNSQRLLQENRPA